MTETSEVSNVIELPTLTNSQLGFIHDSWTEVLDGAGRNVTDKSLEGLLWARSSIEAHQAKDTEDVTFNLRQSCLNDFWESIRVVAGGADAGRAGYMTSGKEAAKVFLNLLAQLPEKDRSCRNVLYGDDFKTFMELSLDVAGLIPDMTLSGENKLAVKERETVEKGIRGYMYQVLDSVYANTANPNCVLLRVGKWTNPTKGPAQAAPKFDKNNGAIIRFNYKEPVAALVKVETVTEALESRMPQSLSASTAEESLKRITSIRDRLAHMETMCRTLIAEAPEHEPTDVDAAEALIKRTIDEATA